MNLFDRVFNEVITPYLEPRIKKRSIKAVKAYVKAIDVARKIAITSYGIGAAAAVLVTGLVLIVVAIIGLLPLNPVAALIAILVLGVLLSSGAAFIAYQGLSEVKWLEMSKSHQMMEAVLKPWETAYSIPDPRKILSSDPADRSYQENRDLATSRANRTPAPTAYDSLEAHAPMATYASMDTPEAALVSGTMDTTDTLRRP